MGLIQIENMEFYSFHGHYKEERIVGNRFLVDLTLETDMTVAAGSDNLKDAVNYQRVYEIVKQQMELNHICWNTSPDGYLMRYMQSWRELIK